MNDDTASTFNHQPAMTFANGAQGITLNPPPPQQAGHCMDVWVVCESLRQTDGTLPTKAQVLADARLAQSNRNNVEQEYYRWRRWRSGGSSSLSGGVNPADSVFHTGDNNMEKPPKKIPFTNTIYYGPPGTGKTYCLSQLLEGYTRPAPSNLNQEEKLGIWRQEFIKNNISNLAWWKVIVAVLLHLGRGARIDEILEHEFIKERAPNGKINAPNVWNSLTFHAVNNLPNINIKTRHKPIVFRKDNEGIWSLLENAQENCKDANDFFESYKNGFPPDWNPETAEVLRNYKVVTFHQSYGYEEFVEGLRPVLSDKEDSEETESDKAGIVRYEIRDGIFKELCNEARKAPKQRFAIIIDEINRGNISKIFGELITLIEADKREGMKNAISVKLPYSGEDFSIPQNVDIIGTMNTADRSLAVLDTALRRRFAFVEMMPDYKVLKDITVDGIKMDELLRRLNERIEVLYDRDHMIGHAYFIPLRDQPTLEHLEQIFQQRIIPLLQEYFFDDWEKTRLVLGDNQKAKEEQTSCENIHPIALTSPAIRFALNPNRFRLLR